jgi:hypothetical protein
MDNTNARFLALGRATLRIYLIVSALMFAGGVIIGAVLAVAGYTLPSPF